MRWWLLCVTCICMLAAGCRAQRSTMLALEQENRQLEDRLYQVSDLLRDCRRENEELRQQLGYSCEKEQPGGGEPGPLPDLSDTPVQQLPKTDSGRFSSPTVEGVPPVGKPADEGRLQLPIHPPLPELRSSPGPESPRSPLPSPGDGTRSTEATPQGQSAAPAPQTKPTEPGTSQSSAPGQSVAGRPRGKLAIEPDHHTRGVTLPTLGDNRHVTSITLNDLILSGYDEDGRPGDDGIVLLVEPRNASGRVVATAAPISVVVLDPALSGEKARLARWDLPVEAVAASYRRMPMAEGVYLKLPWPGALPVHRRLHLFVRFTTDDGRHVETDREIAVEPVTAASANETRTESTSSVRVAGLPRPASGSSQAATARGSRTATRQPTVAPQTNSATAATSGASTPPVAEGNPQRVVAESAPPARSAAGESSADARSAPTESARRPRPVWTPYR